MSGSIWSVLNLEPTRDQKEIRRAYARRLKQTNPEDDAAGFQGLRAAYEHALHYAEHGWNHAGDWDQAAEDEDAEVAAPAELVATILDAAQAPSPTPPAPTASPSPASDPRAVERGALEAACARLERLVEQGTEAAELIPALDAVLDAPALDDVGLYARVEQWLAGLIAHGAPQSDPLVAAAIDYFGWEAQAAGPAQPPAVRAVVARLAALDFRDDVATPGHAHHAAWRALIRAPGRREKIFWRLTPGLPGRVGKLLRHVRWEHPSLLADMNPAALEWWDRFLERPRLSAWVWACMIPGMLAAQLALGLLRPDARWPEAVAWSAAGAAVPIAPGLLLLYGMAWPRRLWAEAWSWRAPTWMRLGWALAAPGLVVAAALLPASIAATVGVGIAGTLVALWALVVGEPDRRKTDNDWPWPVRSALTHVVMAAWWAGVTPHLPREVWIQISAALLPAAFAFSAGAQSLIDAWLDDDLDRRRTPVLIGLGAALLLGGGAVWVAGWFPFLRPLAVAAFSGVALLARPTIEGASEKVRGLRMGTNMLGWLSFLISIQTHAYPLILAGVFWLAAPLAVSIGGWLVAARRGWRYALG